MTAPLCAACGNVADRVLLRPSATSCSDVEFCCRGCAGARRGDVVMLDDAAGALARLGSDKRTRGAGLRLAAALLGATQSGRAREHAKLTDAARTQREAA